MMQLTNLFHPNFQKSTLHPMFYLAGDLCGFVDVCIDQDISITIYPQLMHTVKTLLSTTATMANQKLRGQTIEGAISEILTAPQEQLMGYRMEVSLAGNFTMASEYHRLVTLIL